MAKIFMTLMLIVWFNCLTFCSEEKEKVEVEVYADRIIYHEKEKITQLIGNVLIKYEDVEIQANEVEINDEKEVVRCTGNVKFKKQNEKIEGKEIKYNMKNKEGIIYNAEGVSLPFYFEGEKIIIIPKKINISLSQITTCDKQNPHYDIFSKKVDIYTEDKLIAKKIKFRLFDKTLFYFPAYIVSLKEKERQPFVPRIGHTKQDGWFIKTAYNYYLKTDNYGTLYYDWIQKKGSGGGLRQNFNIKDGKTSVYLYYLKEQDLNKTNLSGDMLYNQQITKDISVLSNVKYANQKLFNREIDTLTSSLTLQRKTKNASTTNTFNLRKIGGDIKTQNFKIGLLQNYQFKDNTTMSFVLDYSENQIKKTYPDKEMQYRADIRKTIPSGNIIAHLNKRIDIDKEKNTYDKYSFLNKEPEVTFQSKTNVSQKIPLQIKYSLLFGKYHEELKNIKENKYSISSHVNFNKKEKNILFDIVSSFSQDFYSTGEAKYQITTSPQIQIFYLKELTQTIRYNYQYNRGPSPFSFDRYGSASNIFSEVKYEVKKVTLRTTCGYDFFQRRYQQLLNYIDITHSNNAKTSFSFGYDIHNKKYGNLNGTTIYDNKKDIAIKTSYTYDINKRELLKIDGDTTIKRFRNWNINHKISYFPQTKKITYNDFLILRDLHCWEAKIMYRHYKKEFFVEFNIKAFPSEKIMLGLDERGMHTQTTLMEF